MCHPQCFSQILLTATNTSLNINIAGPAFHYSLIRGSIRFLNYILRSTSVKDTKAFTRSTEGSATLSATLVSLKIDILELIPSDILTYITSLGAGTINPLLSSIQHTNVVLYRDLICRVTLNPPLTVGIVLDLFYHRPIEGLNGSVIRETKDRLNPTRDIVSCEADSSCRGDTCQVTITDTELSNSFLHVRVKLLDEFTTKVFLPVKHRERTLLSRETRRGHVATVSNQLENLTGKLLSFITTILDAQSSKDISKSSYTKAHTPFVLSLILLFLQWVCSFINDIIHSANHMRNVVL